MWKGASPDCAKPLGELAVCGAYGVIRYGSVVLGRNKVFNNEQHLSEGCAGCCESSVGALGDYC